LAGLLLFSVLGGGGTGIEGAAAASRACIMAGEFGCGGRGGFGAAKGNVGASDAVAATSGGWGPSGASGVG
jgi:hypothetical protein